MLQNILSFVISLVLWIVILASALSSLDYILFKGFLEANINEVFRIFIFVLACALAYFYPLARVVQKLLIP